MIRRQVLLTPQLVEEIQKIAKSHSSSQSAIIRKLLTQALTLSIEKKVKKSTPAGFYDLNDFPYSNPRIEGFKEIFSVGGKTTEVRIVGGSVFDNYLRKGKFSPAVKSKILQTAEELKIGSLNQTLVVRRAYLVPGLSNPPGPRFLNLKPKKVPLAIQQIFDFAIEHGYHQKKDSQVFAFTHPFVDPLSVPPSDDSQVILSYGGHASPLNQNASRVEVFATWGSLNESVQYLEAVDRYIVDAERKIIIEKNIPQKTQMIGDIKFSSTKKIAVPLNRQFEQVLSDGEILEAGRIVMELTRKYGLRRIEFSFDGKGSLVFNESAPYTISVNKIGDFVKKGIIKTVSCEKDVAKISAFTKEEVNKHILYLDKEIVEKRAFGVLNSLSAIPKKFTVFYPGLSATAHAMRVLSDFGHNAIVVGNRIFKDGEEVFLRARSGQIQIDLLARKDIRNFLAHLYDARFLGNGLVGGKAENLSLLKTKGFSVPHGWVLTTNFFDKVIASSSRNQLKIAPLLWEKISQAAGFSNQKKYAVRSSATVEDQIGHAFAGQFKTSLGVESKNISAEVLKVIKSTFSKNVTQYLAALKQPLAIKMAVIIQEMVDAAKAGVIFSRNIQTNDRDQIIIEATAGLGEGVVNGTAKSQRIIFSRSKNQILSEKNKKIKSILSPVEIDSLVQMTLSVENQMEEPQDIEWAINKQGNIWLIQTRPLE